MLFKVDIDSLCLTFTLMNFAAESDTERQTMLFKVDIDSLCLTFPLMNFAAESDTEDSDGEELGLCRPTLIRELRNVLEEYPDDGQILKVRQTFNDNYSRYYY